MSIADKLTTIAENQQRVYNSGYDMGYQDGFVDAESSGGIDVYNHFWDNYQQNGNRRHYDFAFAGQGWTNETFKPKYPIICTMAERVFGSAKIKNVNVPIRIERSSISQFMQASEIETFQELILTRPTSVGSWMHLCERITEIRITCEGTGCLGNGADVYCAVSSLSHDSLISIINALQDLVPLGKTFTFNIGATNKAKLSTAEIAIATQKGWSVV